MLSRLGLNRFRLLLIVANLFVAYEALTYVRGICFETQVGHKWVESEWRSPDYGKYGQVISRHFRPNKLQPVSLIARNLYVRGMQAFDEIPSPPAPDMSQEPMPCVRLANKAEWEFMRRMIEYLDDLGVKVEYPQCCGYQTEPSTTAILLPSSYDRVPEPPPP